MDNSMNRQNDHLGVNKVGKNIKKSPIHQPNFASNANRQQPQPQVYNISKNDFRNIVQQLTGSPSPHRDPLPRPPQNPPKLQNNRLQKIRPPPLAPVNNRPHIPPPVPAAPAVAPPPVPYNNNGFARHGQFGPPAPAFPVPQRAPADAAWANTAESPISAYMRYLQNSIMNPSPGPGGIEAQQQLQPPAPRQMQNLPPPASSLLPNPPITAVLSPRMNIPVMPMPNLPSPHVNGPPPLPSPTSQFLLPSPTGYMNFLSPRSPYPPLSPGMQFPPMTPNFSFSPMGQPGVLGPGPQPPPSPGYLFPLSPSGFFPVTSPRWPQ